ncbi:MAG TPA: hypothetical protein VK524_24910 [Polyangiaceae bacterium]|nr:hypothetical protein [Polyangiaceae bacterium]
MIIPVTLGTKSIELELRAKTSDPSAGARGGSGSLTVTTAGDVGVEVSIAPDAQPGFYWPLLTLRDCASGTGERLTRYIPDSSAQVYLEHLNGGDPVPTNYGVPILEIRAR